MDIEEIKTLTDLMVENDLTEIMIRDGDKKIAIRRGTTAPPPSPAVILPAAAMTPGAPAVSTPLPPEAAPAAPPAAQDKDIAKIVSPMVGTFYAAPDPESPPFVQVGDVVNPETVVCVIEAMKVFNEIKAEVSGTIQAIQIDNGKPVEFGQVLMTVRLS